MSDNVKMLLRYAVTALVMLAIGKGWLPSDIGSPVIEFLLQLVYILIAAAPAIWAWFRVDNAPKAT